MAKKKAYVVDGVLYSQEGTFLAKVQENTIVDENGTVLAESGFLSLFAQDLGYRMVKPPMQKSISAPQPTVPKQVNPEVQMQRQISQVLQAFAEKHQGKALIKPGVMVRFILPDSQGKDGQFKLDLKTLEVTPEYAADAGLKQRSRTDWLIRTYAKGLQQMVRDIQQPDSSQRVS